MTVTSIATPYLGQYVQYIDGIANNPLKATICSVNVDGTVNVIVTDRCVQQYLVRRLPYVRYGARYGGPVRPGDSRYAYQGNGTITDSTPVPPAPQPPSPVPVPGPTANTLARVRALSESLAVTVADTLPP